MHQYIVVNAGFPLVGVPESLTPENYAGAPKFGMPGVHCAHDENEYRSASLGRPKIVILASGGQTWLIKHTLAHTEQSNI